MNVKELRNELIGVFEDLRNRKVSTKDAKELINCAGKIIMSAKAEMDYLKYTKSKKTIDFLESDE
jgi:hypothetical protein